MNKKDILNSAEVAHMELVEEYRLNYVGQVAYIDEKELEQWRKEVLSVTCAIALLKYELNCEIYDDGEIDEKTMCNFISRLLAFAAADKNEAVLGLSKVFEVLDVNVARAQGGVSGTKKTDKKAKT